MLLEVLKSVDPYTLVTATALFSVTYVATQCVQAYLKLRRQWTLGKDFPSPPGHWLLGSHAALNKGKLDHEFLEKILENTRLYPYGFRPWIGPLLCNINLVHPDTIKPVLKFSDPKNWIYNKSFMPWLGEGLLIAKEKKWARNRRLLTPAFHFEILKPYLKVFQSCTDTFMEKLETPEVRENGFELFGNISLLTFDMILQCAFSYTSNCQTLGKNHPYIQAVYDLATVWQKTVLKVSFATFPNLYWLTADGKEFARNCDLVHDTADSVIAQRQRELEESGNALLANKKYLDFLDILLTAKDEDGNGMPKEQLRSEVDTFLFGGHDTTASGISWTIYLLAKHQDYQKLAQEEVDKIYEDNEGDNIKWQDLNRMPYLTQCLKEALRMYPPAAIIGREPKQDIHTPHGTIPRGGSVFINIYGLHHNPAVWGDDHNVFKPDRMSPENMKKMDPFAYIPFSAGPRNCIGQNFALNEEKAVMAILLHNYTFELADPEHKLKAGIQVVLRSDDPIYVKAIPKH